MDISQRIARIKLMATYASKAVHNEGLKELNSSKVYQPLLKSIFLSTEGGDNESMSWMTCTRLDKLIDGREVYITMVEWSKNESSPEYDWYELKSDMDKCSTTVNIKRKLRDMIRNPKDYISVDY